jgi:hypothetical protein
VSISQFPAKPGNIGSRGAFLAAQGGHDAEHEDHPVERDGNDGEDAYETVVVAHVLKGRLELDLVAAHDGIEHVTGEIVQVEDREEIDNGHDEVDDADDGGGNPGHERPPHHPPPGHGCPRREHEKGADHHEAYADEAYDGEETRPLCGCFQHHDGRICQLEAALLRTLVKWIHN